VLKKQEKVNMSDDLKLPKVGELTLPQWQDWLLRYNSVLNDRERRIEKLEAALRAIIVHCEVPAPPNAEALEMFARKALEGKDD
jgi:hypothetical protein